MYKIGEFSTLSKTTIKTLRYYEKEKLLIPKFIDENGYRYYETNQLIDFARIISLKQAGFSISEIKEFFVGVNLNELLEKKKVEINSLIQEKEYQLHKINYLLEEKNMKYEIIMKKLPDYTVYYMEETIKNMGCIPEFILRSADECIKINPDIKCVSPDYCYLNYLDNEYKDSNIRIRYCQAVTKEGVSNDKIKFLKLKPVDAICVYHKGSYETIRETYAYVLKYVEDNGYEIIDCLRERYIDGMWNKENVEDYLTEIQVPVRKK